VTARPRCLFLAPMKPPDDPTPSGDRLIARQFAALLSALGCEASLASRLRTRCRQPADLADRLRQADLELARIVAAERGAARPSCVFTYHNYYKAPDLIGPRLAEALSVPYVIAESSRAPKRASGEWAAAHAMAERASDAAHLILTPTRHDLAMLEAYRPAHQTLALLPPFLDAPAPPLRAEPSGPVRLVAVAMMRRGNKAQSYFALASALEALPASDWTLDIVGDGEARTDIQARFAPFGARARFHGAFDDPARLFAVLAASDIFVWPAIEEPIGMVFLEAQAAALPCIAYSYRGVPDVIEDGVGGCVIPPGDDGAFVAALGRLIEDRALARRLGESARRSYEERHSPRAAAGAADAAFRTAGIILDR